MGYRLRCVSGPCIRADITRAAFAGVPVAVIERLGAQFAASIIPRLVRAQARDAIRWHLARGDRVVVVSASLDVYLERWCEAHGVEVICTRLEAHQGKLTGRYLGGDCSGAVKRERILSRYRISDYRYVHAYGDTDEDRPMLDLADRRYLCWRAVDPLSS